MQIRLTVLAPRGGHAAGRSCDVLVTAPAGTALAAVAAALATAVSGPDAPGTVVLYSGRERLDAQRCALGEPPLIDGAVLSLQVPGETEVPTEDAPAQLHVVAGPDAGGVHLLHGGQIRIGRSADADVPLDDPDVSRLHCAVTVAEDGGVTVADLQSTNGTTLEGVRVGPRPVRLAPGALLRLGESALRLTGGRRTAALATAADGEGHLRITRPETRRVEGADSADGANSTVGTDRAADTGRDPYPAGGRAAGSPPGALPYGDATGAPDDRGTAGHGGTGPDTAPGGGTRGRHAGGGRAPGAYDAGQAGASTRIPGAQYDRGRFEQAGHDRRDGRVPRDGRDGHDGQYDTGRYDGHSASRPEYGGSQYGNPPGAPRVPDPRSADTHYGRTPLPGVDSEAPYGTRDSGHSRPAAADPAADPAGPTAYEEPRPHSRTPGSRRQETPPRGTEPPDLAARRRGGIGAWARRLAGSRGDELPETAPGPAGPATAAGRGPSPETWPDPATVLLTALGPGPRLWERGSRHAEALAVRIGTADRPSTDGTRPLPLVPVTVGLREAGSLGIAGPRERLTGLARWTVAQLAALHAPADLEIVLISADRARSLAERTQDWSWLGWLPHVRPAHGQDCRLLLAYDADQAAARTDELTRRLDDGPLGPGWASADPWTVTEAAARHDGPYTLVIVDGDPGSAALRETTARLAGGGAAAGIHLLCLAETESASPLSPIAATYETACAASLPFRECGAVALLSGDVATTLRLLRTAVGQPAGHGTLAVVDAVSPAWAERFGRALAPLRAAASGRNRPAAALPRSSRLLDELGLARATPASLMARWASAADRTLDCTAVLGAGPRGPVSVDLTEEGPHLLIEGPAGSGRTELLRSIAASLAAGARPDRLGLLLVDGAGGERGEGLSVCTELPHVTEHLVASDPVRMRQFAQALGGELKRRAELLGRLDFTEWHSGARDDVRDHRDAQDPRSPREPQDPRDPQQVPERLISQRGPSAAEQRAGDTLGGGTLRLRHAQTREQGRDQPREQSRDQARDQSRDQSREQTREQPREQDRSRPRVSARSADAPLGADAPLPRLVVLVDDYEALVAPSLGSPGRPSAGSVVRALEAVARDGERLGVHLVAASARPERTVDTELAQGARLRVVLDAPPAAPAPDDPAPGRGRLGHPDGRVTPFQGGRVTGRIPRTATLRPTVTVVEWERMGDPPARRPVRELGNGPTDLALLASALERAARSVDAVPLAPLTPAHP